VKPENSGHLKLGLSRLSGVSRLFPGVSGVHTETPSHSAAMEKGQLRRKPATNLIPRKAIKPPTFNKVGLLLVLLPNTNMELQLISVPKPLVDSFSPFHQMSGWSTLPSILESPVGPWICRAYV
jgi:hypothetical protein